MADPNALAAALTALTTVLTNIQADQAAAAAAAVAAVPTVHVPTFDPFEAATAFDLSSRAGSLAYTTACSPLELKWDGTINKFPSFLIALRVRASEVNWGAPAPQGILAYTVGGTVRNLFTDHYSISEADLEAARAARTDDRAVQNSRTLFKCLKHSIEGDLRATLFDQDGNLPTHEDGPLFFKRLTSFTMAASLQLSMHSFQHILEFDPADHGFNIPTINTKLNHLFVLATTRERNLTQEERIQHTLTVYSRIKQPEIWAQYIRNQVDAFEEGTLINCQAVMNAASLKFTKISSTDSRFSSTTVTEDIVAMVATKRKKAPAGANEGGDTESKKDKDETKAPPFVKHFKSGSGDNATMFKVGDKKEWNGLTYHFCDCPTHRAKIKWHTHTAETCRTRKKWLEDGGTLSRNPPVAQIADNGTLETETMLTNPTGVTSTQGSSSTDITTMLAAALSMAGDNTAAKNAIADALNAIHDI
jgi:hypothetical protein